MYIYIYIYIYNFDVTMESDDEAEVCLLSGIFMLSLTGNKCNTNNIGTSEYTEMTDWQFLKIQATAILIN